MALGGGLHGPGKGRQDLCLPAAEETLRAVDQVTLRHQRHQTTGKALRLGCSCVESVRCGRPSHWVECTPRRVVVTSAGGRRNSGQGLARDGPSVSPGRGYHGFNAVGFASPPEATSGQNHPHLEPASAVHVSGNARCFNLPEVAGWIFSFVVSQ